MLELILYKDTLECEIDVGNPGSAFCPEDSKEKWTKGVAFLPDLSTSTVLSLSRDIFKFEQVDMQFTSYTHNFTLAGTDKNIEFFNNFGILNSINELALKPYRAVVKLDGTQLFGGSFYIKRYDQNSKLYTCQMLGDLAGFKDSFTGKKVSDLKYFTQFNHKWQDVSKTIVDSGEGKYYNGFDNTGTTPTTDSTIPYFYPLQDYQGLGYFHNENIQSIKNSSGAVVEKFVPFHTAFADDITAGNASKHPLMTPLDGAKLPIAFRFLPLIEAILVENGYSADLDWFKLGPDKDKWNNLFVQTPLLDLDNVVKQSLDTNSTGGIFNPIGKYNYYPVNGVKVVYREYPLVNWDNFPGQGGRYIVQEGGAYNLDMVASMYCSHKYDNINGNGSLGAENWQHMAVFKDSAGVSTEIGSYQIGHAEGLANGNGIFDARNVSGSVLNVALLKGDEIYLKLKSSFYNLNTTIVRHSISVYNFTLKVTTSEKASVYGDRFVGKYFEDIEQAKLLKEFMSLSKTLLVFPVVDDPSLVIFRPIVSLWTDHNIVQMDITDMIDRSKGFDVIAPNELIPETIQFKWAKTIDLLTSSFRTSVGEDYGAVRKVVTGVKFGNDKYDIESLFGSHITGRIPRLSDDGLNNLNSVILPMKYKGLEKFDRSDDNFSLFLRSTDGTQSSIECQDITLIGNVGSTPVEMTHYQMCHNMLIGSTANGAAVNNLVLSGGEQDINWEWSVPYSIDSSALTPAVNKGLYNQYYKPIIDAAFTVDAMIIDAGILLTPEEYGGLDLFSPVMLDGSRYRILGTRDYDLIGNKPMMIRLMKDTINMVSATLTPILATPTGLAGTYNAITDILDTSWSPVPHATNYKVTIKVDGYVVYTVDTQYTDLLYGIPQSPTGPQTASVTVIAEADGYSDSPGAISAPITIPIMPPLAIPTGLVSSWACENVDEQAVTFSWNAAAGTTYLFTALGDVDRPVVGNTVIIFRSSQGSESAVWSVKAVKGGQTSLPASNNINIPPTNVC